MSLSLFLSRAGLPAFAGRRAGASGARKPASSTGMDSHESNDPYAMREIVWNKNEEGTVYEVSALRWRTDAG